MPDKIIVTTITIDELKAIIVGSVTEALQTIQSKPNNPEPEIMKVAEVAKFFDLSTASIYKKVSDMEIPHIKQGKRLYFRRSELLKYLDQGRRRTKKEITEAVESEPIIHPRKKRFG